MGFLETSLVTTTESSLDDLPPSPAFQDDFNSSHAVDRFYSNGTQTVQFSTAFQVIIYIIYNTVFVAALLGNILVCYVVLSSPRMRTVTNILIANLALGDLLMALLCVPFSYISVLLQYWPFGKVLCHLVAPSQAVCVFVSAYTLVALAGDRYVAILYPLKPRMRRSQAVIVICIVWIVALLTAIPIAIYTDMVVVNGNPECTEVWPNESDKLLYSLTLMGLQYFFPLAVLIFTYTRIALAVWGKKAPGEAEDARDQRLAKAKRKMIKMMLTVVIVYTVSWLPFNAIVVIGDLDPSIWSWEHMTYTFPIIQWLALAHTVCNPIIYCWMNSRFRAGFRSAFDNVPLLNRLRFFAEPRPPSSHHHNMNTYTFQSGGVGGHGKLVRHASLISNGRTTSVNLSPSHLTATNNSPESHQKVNNGENTRPQMSLIPSQPKSSPPSRLTSHSLSPNRVTNFKNPPSLVFDETASSVTVRRPPKSLPKRAPRHDSMLESFM